MKIKEILKKQGEIYKNLTSNETIKEHNKIKPSIKPKEVVGIYNFKELESLPLGTVIFYKQGRVFSFQSPDDYDVGVVIPSGLPKEIKEEIISSFEEAVKKTYESPVMEEIRERGKDYHWDWDRLVGSYMILGNSFEKEIPDNKACVVANAPVPENGMLAEKFALELERILREEIKSKIFTF